VPEVQLPFPFSYPLSRKRFTQKPIQKFQAKAYALALFTCRRGLPMKWEALPLTSVQDIAAALPSQILDEKPRLLNGIFKIKHLKLCSKKKKKYYFL